MKKLKYDTNRLLTGIAQDENTKQVSNGGHDE